MHWDAVIGVEGQPCSTRDSIENARNPENRSDVRLWRPVLALPSSGFFCRRMLPNKTVSFKENLPTTTLLPHPLFFFSGQH